MVGHSEVGSQERRWPLVHSRQSGGKQGPEKGTRGSAQAFASGRRTTAKRVQIDVCRSLKDRLPADWVHCPLPLAEPDTSRKEASPHILVIAPTGRCHFLFAKAPPDQWWDGDIRRVPAEPLTREEDALIRRLRKAGHAARAVWTTKDAQRALASWGCRLSPDGSALAPGGEGTPTRRPPRQSRQQLKLNSSWEDKA